MKNKDYWNVKEAKKIELRNSLLRFTIFFIILILLLYLMRPLDLFISLIALGGVIWNLYGFYKKQSRIISYPVIRIQNKLLIYNYDQKIISWNHIYKITWNSSKSRVTIFYRIPSQVKFYFLTPAYERFDNIDVKWIENKKNFIQELKSICEEKGIPFIIKDKNRSIEQEQFSTEDPK